MSTQIANDVPPSRPPRRPIMQVVREAPVTVLIFAVCIVVFLAAEQTGSTKNNLTLIRFGAVWRELVWAGQYWRLATSMFLHIGVLHLFMNTYFGFRICTIAEQQLGHWKFLALYLGSGIVGSAASVIGHDALSAGASGALFGVIGWLLGTLRVRAGSWRAFVQNPAVRQQLIWFAAWFLIGAFIGLDNYAHGGGMLFGGLYAWALAAQPGRSRRWRVAAVVWFGGLLVFASLRPLPLLHGKSPPVEFPAGD